jgi:hypothetical protein
MNPDDPLYDFMVQHGLIQQPAQAGVLPRAAAAAGQAREPQVLSLPQAAARYLQRADELYGKAEQKGAEEVDLSAMQDYARQRKESGNSAMLNALAAQFAGERFQPVGAKYLKRAMGAQDPIKVGSGVITGEGQYLKDPFAAQEREVKSLLDRAGALERLALQAQTAEEKNRLTAAQNEISNQLRLMGIELRSQNAGARPYFTPLPTANGYVAFDNRSATASPVTVGGQPIVRASDDPNVQGAIAGARETGKLTSNAAFDAPKAISQGEETVRLVDDLLKHPGFKQAVGGSRMFGIQKIYGTNAKDFDIRLDQLQGKQFLEAYEMLKGGGHITEIEGVKATAAIARMNAAGSEEGFIEAARDFQKIVRLGVERARNSQKQTQGSATTSRRIKFNSQGEVVND